MYCNLFIFFSSYVRTDIIRRVMMNMFNIDIVMVMGVTDIDDKIIKRSKEVSQHLEMLVNRVNLNTVFFNSSVITGNF